LDRFGTVLEQFLDRFLDRFGLYPPKIWIATKATMATRQVKNYAEWLGLDPKDRWIRGWILARVIAVISNELTPLIECIIPPQKKNSTILYNYYKGHNSGLARKETVVIINFSHRFVQIVSEFSVVFTLTPQEDTDLMYLAREGLKAPLAEGWKPCTLEKNPEKSMAYGHLCGHLLISHGVTDGVL
jgi:hypothetical protein